MKPLLDEIKEVKKRSRVAVDELSATASEESRILQIIGKIREKVALLDSEEERQLLLVPLNEIHARHKGKYDETRDVIMTIEREISISSDEEAGAEGPSTPKRRSMEDVPSVAFTIMPKETFVVPVFERDGQFVATSHLSRSYILNKTDIRCKQCVQSRNETFSGWFTERHGFSIRKCRLDPSMESDPPGNAELIGQWRTDGYDIKPTKSGGGIKLIPLEEARIWYAKEDIGHKKQLESLKKSCTHSPRKN